VCPLVASVELMLKLRLRSTHQTAVGLLSYLFTVGLTVAQLYDDVIINVLDRFIPFRTVKCRRRPSNPWFDEECRAAKRLTRRLERAARRPDTSNAAAAAAATAE